MKSIRIALFSALLSFTSGIWAQTTDDFIAQGKSYLAATNLIGANNSFSNAVVLSPTNPTGNVLYALTRLLVLPYTTSGSNFLNRLGVPVDGRNVYNWTAQLPADTNGVPLAPQGVNAAEATDLLRTNILPALGAAEANLATVNGTNFLLSLSSQETDLAAVQIDYGDVLLLRAILEAGIYFGYTLNSWNLDAQLAAVRSLYLSDGLSPAQLLARYPELFTFSATNDLALAKTSFANAVSLYLQASAFIRARSINEIRLFNLDVAKANKEDDFRRLLTGLQSALDGPVRLDVGYHLTINLAPLFDGSHPLRSVIPQFSGPNYVLGTLDPTFEGIITGLDRGDAETFLAQYFPPITEFSTAGTLGQNQFLVQLNILPGRGYTIESSRDLMNWSPVVHEFATNSTITLVDPIAGKPGVFYRAHEESNDRFAHAYAINGLPASTSGSSLGATPEPGDPTNYFNQVFGTGTPVWWTWTAPATGVVGVSAAGSAFNPVLGVFTGNTLAQLASVPNLAANSPNPNEFDFQANAGTTYFIAVESGYFFQQGSITLTLAGLPANDNFDNRQVLAGTTISVNGCNILATEEPNESSGGGHSVWYSWTAPSAGSVIISATGTGYPFARVYIGSELTSLAQIPTSYAGGSALSFDATPGVTYQIQVDGYNTGNFTLGLTLSAGRYPLFLSVSPSEGGTVSVQPPPDTNGMYAAGTSITVSAQAAPGFSLGQWNGSVTASGSVTQIILAMTGSQNLQVSFNPLNDNFADAAPLNGDNITLQGTTDGASNEPNEPGFFYGTVWYSWTAPTSGSTTIWFRNPYYAQLSIYTGNQLTNLNPIALFATGSSHGVVNQTFDATAGTTYYIQIGGYAPAFTLLLILSENFYALAESAFPPVGGTVLVSPPPDSNGLYPAGTNVSLTAQPAPGFLFAGWSGSVSTGGSTPVLVIPINGSQRLVAVFNPVNDAFVNRIVLSGTNALTNGTTAGASSEPGETCTFCQTVWYSWTAPGSGTVTLSLGSTSPAQMNVYTGNQLNTLLPVAGASTGLSGNSLTETFNIVAGTTYQIQVDGVGSAFQLSLNF